VSEQFMNLLTAEEIAAAHDIQEKIVPIPAWGGAVKVRTLTKAAQQAMRNEAKVDGELDTDAMEMLMFKYGVIEPKLSTEQVMALREKSSTAFDQVLQAIIMVTGASGEAIQQAEAEFRTVK
jgi:hypothetical protein